MGRRQGGKALGGGAMPFAAESWKRWRSLLKNVKESRHKYVLDCRFVRSGQLGRRRHRIWKDNIIIEAISEENSGGNVVVGSCEKSGPGGAEISGNQTGAK